MILADTSVWIDHLRAGDAGLVDLLRNSRIATHPFVIGEIALGSLRQREIILQSLHDLPQLPVADEREVGGFIERHRLFGRGIGYIDAHLLASVTLAPGTSLWTRDRRLRDAAAALKLAYSAGH